MTFQQHLVYLGVVSCRDARRYVGDKTFQEAWETTKRADWMMWLLGRMSDTKGWPPITAVVDCVAYLLKEVGYKEPFNYSSLDGFQGVAYLACEWCYGRVGIEKIRLTRDHIILHYAKSTMKEKSLANHYVALLDVIINPHPHNAARCLLNAMPMHVKELPIAYRNSFADTIRESIKVPFDYFDEQGQEAL